MSLKVDFNRHFVRSLRSRMQFLDIGKDHRSRVMHTSCKVIRTLFFSCLRLIRGDSKAQIEHRLQ